ncbi:FecR family protein [Chitinophaga flava]|uniref:Iron dicitrate transport regulator FecR n=1 Tax=Chitinophaga flava TaxID=2259036 RepID=A0A365XV45_9BACT|nr:FecR family protein [Chitinophaga flava]RBL90229.1 iron dicitrate transport regulator FecR [Chitinophaga flava]
MDASRFSYLLEQYKSGCLSASEQEELFGFAGEGDEHDWQELLSPWMNEEAGFAEKLDQELVARELAMVLSTDRQTPGGLREMPPAVHRIHFIRRWGWAAAVLAGLLTLGTYYFIDHRKEPSGNTIAKISDVRPGSSKAILTLADGSHITLDSTGNQVILQGTAAVHQQNGSLQYEVKGQETGVGYNQLSTPRQGQFRLVLADGTKVWLNAASSIRYPTAFTGKERNVEVTGEAYFEVAANAHQPFIVTVNNTAIQVLGTSFNINAYPEEGHTSATLVSGLIKVNTGQESLLLQPGKTAAVMPNGSTTVSTANLKAVMAWKDGFFWFENADIKTVMRQLARWYNIEVEFRGAVPKTTFSGEIERSLTLEQVLQGLGSNELHYIFGNGNKLIIQQ